MFSYWCMYANCVRVCLCLHMADCKYKVNSETVLFYNICFPLTSTHLITNLLSLGNLKWFRLQLCVLQPLTKNVSKQIGVLLPVNQCSYIRAIHILSLYITFQKCRRVKTGTHTTLKPYSKGKQDANNQKQSSRIFPKILISFKKSKILSGETSWNNMRSD